MSKTNTPKVSIGIPIYNGEKFIRNVLDSIHAQTLSNFEIIISDNCSTDSTPVICKEYSKKDKRIKYFRQEKTYSPWYNYIFVLREARSKYFVWLAADDFWDPEFLQKNIDILESNHSLVGSISQVDFYGKQKNHYDDNFTKDNFPKYRHVHPVSGIWREKVEFYLKFRRATILYAVYETDRLKNSLLHLNYVYPGDLFIILNILKYGDLHVLDEILMHRYAGGASSKNIIKFLKQQNMRYDQIIFMYVPFMSWCIKNFGLGFIIKNISSFFQLHCIGYGKILLDILRS